MSCLDIHYAIVLILPFLGTFWGAYTVKAMDDYNYQEHFDYYCFGDEDDKDEEDDGQPF